MIPTYYCILVYFVGNVCAAPWGRSSCGSGYVRRGFFLLLAFKFLVDGPGWPLLVLFL